MIEYRDLVATWATPKGRSVEFAYREDTSDWNTITSIALHDEYEFANLSLSGLALDIGAHLGTAAICLALDNPELEVIAVEAIAENAELARLNVLRNRIEDRVTVLHSAAAAPDVAETTVFWRSRGDENAEHHAFIGNSQLVYEHGGEQPHETATVACVSLSALLMGRTAALVKIDCEGCEWSFLTDPAVARVDRIVGEWHPTGGHTARDVEALLGLTHDVTLSGSAGGPGAFTAVRR